MDCDINIYKFNRVVYGEIKVHNLCFKIGGRSMCKEVLCRRPMYTNNEIVYMFKKKFEEKKDSIRNICDRYKVDARIVELMFDRSCHYNYKMLKIAADYTEVDYKELVGIIQDDDNCSLRADSTEEVEELNCILNYLFDEMINQKRMSAV